MKKIYLAGPITGFSGYKDAFGEAEALFRSGDTFVVNPASLPEDQTAKWYMQHLLPQLMDCDLVVLLPGWRGSRGASIEAALARYIRIPLVHLEDR